MISFALSILLAASFGSSAYSLPYRQPGQDRSSTADCRATAKESALKHDAAVRLMKEGKLSIALTLFADAYALCRSNDENAYDLAAAEIMDGEYKNAEELVGSLLRQSDKAELHTLLGRIKFSEKDYKAAAEQYQTAAQMNPSESNIFDFGTSLMKLDYSAATKIFRYGVETFPHSVRLHVALATALYAQGGIDEGAALLCKAAELDPLDPHPMEVLADTQNVPQSSLPEAVRHLADLHRRYPRDGLILFDYAVMKSERWSGEKDAIPPDLVNLLKTAISLDPKLPQAYFALGAIYEKQRKYADEIAVLEKAIMLDPDKEQYHYRLAFAYRQTGDVQGFKRELSTYQELHAKSLTLK